MASFDPLLFHQPLPVMSVTGGAGNGMTGNSNASTSKPGSATEDGFVEVWAKNLEDVFVRIRQIVQKYPYVAMVSLLISYAMLMRVLVCTF